MNHITRKVGLQVCDMTTFCYDLGGASLESPNLVGVSGYNVRWKIRNWTGSARIFWYPGTRVLNTRVGFYDAVWGRKTQTLLCSYGSQ
eukprot:1347582-Rhodomonas_salina.1